MHTFSGQIRPEWKKFQQFFFWVTGGQKNCDANSDFLSCTAVLCYDTARNTWPGTKSTRFMADFGAEHSWSENGGDGMTAHAYLSYGNKFIALHRINNEIPKDLKDWLMEADTHICDGYSQPIDGTHCIMILSDRNTIQWFSSDFPRQLPSELTQKNAPPTQLFSYQIF